jgi:hypothetical protein
MSRYLIIMLFCLMPLRATAAQKLAYYSDYFSFIGRDAGGLVAFALDNNRGVDGDKYQAEHFGVLYGRHTGWVKLIGLGNYANDRGILKRIPDSSHFQFDGAPDSGLTIRSRANRLVLHIDPLTIRLRETKGQRTLQWGAAQAVLQWKGRTISGRVIYEHLVHLGWNRLTRTYPGTWNNFQGFYLALDRGAADTWRDLYLRSEGEGKQRRTKGFITADDWRGEIHSTRFEAADRAFTFGFYRWPQRWVIEIKGTTAGNAAGGRLTLHQVSRENQRNWIIGGFAMAVVAGQLSRNGVTTPVVGLAELIK